MDRPTLRTYAAMARQLHELARTEANTSELLELLSRVLTALAADPAGGAVPELPALQAWACQILGHEWVVFDESVDVPYCLYCETDRPLSAAATPSVWILLASAVAPDGRFGAYEATIDDAVSRQTLTGSAAGMTTFALLLDAAIAAFRAVDPTRPVRLWAPSQSLVNPIARDLLAPWAARGWTTQRGEPIAHAERWQTLAALLAGRSVTVDRVPPERSAYMARAVARLTHTLERKAVAS